MCVRGVRALLLGALLAIACGGESTEDGSGGSSGSAGSGGNAGVGGSPGLGGDAGVGGSGGSAGTGDCWSNEKWCGDLCRSKTDPSVGCATLSCAPCNLPNADASCGTNGLCAIGSCVPGFSDCDAIAATGCETNVLSDPTNCGACGNSCGPAGICVQASCACSCPAGLVVCGSSPCSCVDIATDPAHCGACDTPCPAGAQCIAGLCA
jgi:hypothetical protein